MTSWLLDWTYASSALKSCIAAGIFRLQLFWNEDEREGTSANTQLNVQEGRLAMGELVWTGGNGRVATTEETVSRSPRSDDRLERWKKEIAESYETMKDMVDMDPVRIFQCLSQFSARASEIRSQIGPQEGKREAAFRIRIIDPFIEECDRQFKIHSRIVAIQEMDARLAGGRFA